MSLKNIIENNHYPIVFIGSGISKRYIQDSPAWIDLIEEYWKQEFPNENLYTFFHNLDLKNGDATKDQQDFIANTKAMDRIEEHFNALFYQEERDVTGLTIKEAQQKRLSPFKYDLANKFSDFRLKSDIDTSEYKLFKQFINKSRMIITTNYDEFIEKSLNSINSKPNVYVGQNGLFDNNAGWSELYKIHGSVTDPQTIVINSDDYNKYDENSILLSAKILSSMIDSPIIFLGYSLTDRNIRKLLNDFSQQLPAEDTRKSANRIYVIQYEKNQMETTEELVSDPILNFNYTLINTDNYSKIYSDISKINEGASPYEVRKYQDLIRKIIVDYGSRGSLESVLVSPQDLSDISNQIDQGKPIVVAMGDAKYFYVYPDLLSYIKDYFNETNNYLPAVALSFVAHDGNRLTKTPFSRYLKSVDQSSLKLKDNDVEKLNHKIQNCPSLDSIINSIGNWARIDISSIEEAKNITSRSKMFMVLTYNLKRLDKTDLHDFILNSAIPLFEKSVKDQTNLRTDVRKFLLGYDLLVNGDLKEIKKPAQNP